MSTRHTQTQPDRSIYPVMLCSAMMFLSPMLQKKTMISHGYCPSRNPTPALRVLLITASATVRLGPQGVSRYPAGPTGDNRIRKVLTDGSSLD
jgi:hypothetical protein